MSCTLNYWELSMTSKEIWIVIILGLVGYWGTSALINFFKRESDWTASQQKNAANQEESTYESKPKNTNSTQSWFEILGVDSTASLEEIKIAYKKKISMYHPDKVSSMAPEFNEIAQKKSMEINAAYDEAVRLKYGS
jgi:hypothetical protein